MKSVIVILENAAMSARKPELVRYVETHMLQPLFTRIQQHGFHYIRVNTNNPLLNVDELTQIYDNFIIVGGEDIHPNFHGNQLNYPKEEKHYITADVNQMKIVHTVLQQRKKLVGFCRGLQIINTAFSGTLHPHLYSDLHRKTSLIPEERIVQHTIAAIPYTQTHEWFTDTAEVISSHHQGIFQLGENLHATAYASDGLIEAVEHKQGNIIGFQFHPEHILAHPAQLNNVLSFFNHK